MDEIIFTHENYELDVFMDLLHEKPELAKIIEIIRSFPEECQAEAIRVAVDFLESKKALVDSAKSDKG